MQPSDAPLARFAPLSLPFLIGGLCLWGCDDTATDNTPDSPAPADATSETSEDAPEGDAGDTDARDPRDPTPDDDCPGDWMVSWAGRVQDDDGAPVPGALAQMCLRSARSGELVCLRPSTSDDQGQFEVLVPYEERCVDEVAARIFSFDEALAEIYCPVELGTGTPFVESDRPIRLQRVRPPVDLPPLDGTRTPRTVDFGDGLTVRLVPEILDVYIDDLPGAYASLGARVLVDEEDQRALCFVGADAPLLDGLAVFTPGVDVFGRPFSATFPNTAGRAPGTAMELYLLGGLTTTLDAGQSVKEGEWRAYGAGVVSEDGAVIRSENAIHALTWYGWRPVDE
jgi:hypothetical protein